MMDKIHISKSFLSSGKDFKINNIITIKHPIVQEVLDIDKENGGFHSEEVYYSWVSIFLCDPYDYMVFLDDKKIDYEKVEPFDLFLMLYQDMVERYKKIQSSVSKDEFEIICSNNPYFQACKFFFNKDRIMLANDGEGNKVIADANTMELLLNKEIFVYVSEFIRLINGIDKGDRINPSDEFSKQILIEDERSRLKKLAKKPPEEKENNRLGNLLSAITWGGNGGITPFNRNKLHMYDLVDGIQRTDKLLNFNHTMAGLYSGCVDKDKLNMQKISWTS